MACLIAVGVLAGSPAASADAGSRDTSALLAPLAAVDGGGAPALVPASTPNAQGSPAGAPGGGALPRAPSAGRSLLRGAPESADPTFLSDIRVTPDDDFEVEDLDDEIPFEENDDLLSDSVRAGSGPGFEPAPDDDQIDWSAAARKLKGLLLAPVEVVDKVVRRVNGRKKTVHVRRRADPVPLDDDDIIALLRLRPIVPVDGIDRTDLTDSFFARRSSQRKHNAIDIGAPEGTPVLAAVDGTVARFSRTRKGGVGLYLVDDAGKFTFYYAHLRGFAPGLEAGDRVAKGDILGYVGHTGNAKRRGPHLHLALAVLDGTTTDPGVALKKRAIVNPYPLLAFIP